MIAIGAIRRTNMFATLARIAIAITALACTRGVVPASAADFVMKFGTATINETQHQFIKFYKDEVEKASNGRIEVQSGKPARPDPARDRRRPTRQYPGLYRTGRFFCWGRSPFRRVLRADVVPRRAERRRNRS